MRTAYTAEEVAEIENRAFQTGIITGELQERDRIIALLEANVGHSMDRYRYWSEAFELIKGEEK